jgi:hypothetical protein
MVNKTRTQWKNHCVMWPWLIECFESRTRFSCESGMSICIRVSFKSSSFISSDGYSSCDHSNLKCDTSSDSHENLVLDSKHSIVSLPMSLSQTEVILPVTTQSLFHSQPDTTIFPSISNFQDETPSSSFISSDGYSSCDHSNLKCDTSSLTSDILLWSVNRVFCKQCPADGFAYQFCFVWDLRI